MSAQKNIERLLGILSTMHFLPADFQASLREELISVTFPKGHHLVQAYTAAHHSYFLEKGFAVGFRYLRNARVVTNFWQPGDIILSPKSFFRQVPADEIIQLTADAELLSLSYAAALKLSKAFPVANALARDITAEHFSRAEERIADLHTMNAWDRYTKLLRTYPGIEMHVSQDLIASYLHITPQSLSRLRGKHMKDNE